MKAEGTPSRLWSGLRQRCLAVLLLVPSTDATAVDGHRPLHLRGGPHRQADGLELPWPCAERRDCATTLRRLQDTLPQVRVETVTMLPGSRRIDLTGDMQPFNTAPIYARSTGYVLTRLVEIGTKVGKGQLLATIAADRQLASREALRGRTLRDGYPTHVLTLIFSTAATSSRRRQTSWRRCPEVPRLS